MGMAPSMATPPTDRGVPHLVKRIKPEYNFDFVVRPIAKRQSGYWPLRNRHRQGPAAMRWTPRCSPGAEGRITSCLSPFRNRTPKSMDRFGGSPVLAPEAWPIRSPLRKGGQKEGVRSRGASHKPRSIEDAVTDMCETK